MSDSTTTVENLTEGDLIDLEDLLLAWGARDESFETDLMAVQSELATVETIAPNADGSVTIFTDLMNLAVPAGTAVPVPA